MAADHIATATVAANVAETDPIVLRESDSRRLVFKPMLVDQAEAPVPGNPGRATAWSCGPARPSSRGSRPGRSRARSSASPRAARLSRGSGSPQLDAELDRHLSGWDANEDNNDEDFWQDLLKRNAWDFSQLTGSPVVLLQEKAYVGGKGVSNTGGGQVDYLLANELTENVALVEIKTPGASLCVNEYRNRAYSPGEDVVGAVVQA